MSAHDVADAIRQRLGADLGVVKLHKLLYYAQGWHLAWTGEPLFDDRVEAWAHGPVVAELWADEQHDRGRPPAQPLRGRAHAIVDYVVERYGHLSGADLIRQTHAEDPWRRVSERDDDGVLRFGSSPEISIDAMKAWFVDRPEHRDYAAEVDRLSATGSDPFDDFENSDQFAAAIRRAVGD